MCNHLPPLPKTGFSSPTDLPRDGKTLDVLLTPALARVHLNRDFCSPVCVWLNGLGDIPLQHLTAFFWPSQAATSKSPNVLLSFLNSQFSISKEILSLRSLIQEYWHKISLQWPCCTSSCTVLVSGFCCSGECASALLSENHPACGQMAADEALQNLTLDSLLVNHSDRFNLFCKMKIIWFFKKKHLRLL